uniref:Uncharacterized protein n=1 Tax=Gadus morhua TaxID=8049 RepID=A0A8C5BTN8_GADMO
GGPGWIQDKHALVNHADAFGDRELTLLMHTVSKENGILFANGKSWKEMIRFTLTTLREFGMGKNMSEEKIIEECEKLMEVLEQHKEKYYSSSELSSMIGSRQVKVEDRKNLPYTDAVIHETQRLANVLPMSLPHTTSQDVTFQGYFIKQDTVLYPLLTSVLWDETEWESPLSFNPSHFLDEDGKGVTLFPVSGRRACVGESLARMELFLFFTTLLQRFRFTPPPGVTEEDLDLTPTWGLTLNPSPHQLCAHRRVEAES